MLRRVTVLALAALAYSPLNAAQSDPIDAIVTRGDAVAAHSRHGRRRDPQGRDRQGAGLRAGQRRAQRAGHRRTIFQSGSLGKQFTATAVMLQVEDGRLSLTDPIAKFFANAPGVVARHHRAPPADAHVGHSRLHRRPARLPQGLHRGRARQVRRNAAARLRARRGVEVQQHRLHPARRASCARCRDRSTATCCAIACSRRSGMTTARVISEADIVPHRAAGYRLERGELRNQEWVSPAMNTTADGSLYLSLQDLIAWDRGIRAGAVLQPESWRQIFTPVTLNSGRDASVRVRLRGRSHRRPGRSAARRLVAGLQDLHRALPRRRHHDHRAGQSRAGQSQARRRSRLPRT